MRTRSTAAALASTAIALGALGCGPKINISTVQNTSSATGMLGTMSPMPENEVVDCYLPIYTLDILIMTKSTGGASCI